VFSALAGDIQGYQNRMVVQANTNGYVSRFSHSSVYVTDIITMGYVVYKSAYGSR